MTGNCLVELADSKIFSENPVANGKAVYYIISIISASSGIFICYFMKDIIVEDKKKMKYKSNSNSNSKS
jgi:hypothetical protein